MTTSDEMGNFCHDHIEHPLLWCDEKKRLVERRNAEESLRMWRRRKAEEIARKEKDKQEYYDMFVKHCPWGRPGGGAPNVDVRRKDITAVGLHSTPNINTIHRLSSFQAPCRYADYFSQSKKCNDPLGPYHSHSHSHLHHAHHHASGPRLHHHLGNSVTVGEGKNGHVDIEVRYKPMLPSKGKPLLEKITVTESNKCPMVQGQGVQAHTTSKASPMKKASLAAKMEKPPSKEPWGKPGPGGKPWRSPKEVGSSFMKSLGWTNKEMLKDLDQDNPVTPAEKPTFRKVKTNKKPQGRCCDVCTCTCQGPAAPLGPCSPSKTKKPMTFSPTKAATKSTKFEAIKQKICPRFLRRCPAETNTTDTSALPAGGGVELVPLLARRRANARPISLSSTDVTKRAVSNERLSTALDPRYLHDLNTQISQKRRSISVAHQIEQDLCNRHFQTFDTFWGRPGHGAPGEIKTKLKLDNLLYGLQGYSE